MKQLSSICLTSMTLAILVVAQGCSNVENITGQEPIIDTQGIDIAAYEEDLVDCREYADEVQVGRQASVGAATGAVVGGAIGAVLGNSSSAGRGAGAGAVSGTFKGASSGLRDRQRVIRNCLQGRGYRVLN